MEKGHRRFDFYLAGCRGDYNACIKILNDLNLDDHGIQYLCVKEDGTSIRPGKHRFGGVNLAGLIEMKEGTDVGEMVVFFHALLTPFQHCLSLIKLCKDGPVFDGSCFEKKGSVMVKKGTPTNLHVKRLLDEKRRCRWDLRHR